MNAPENLTRSLPRYGVRDDEKTRPCVVLFDWSGDDEVTVRVPTLESRVARPPNADREDDFDADLFRPRWHGIGRKPGAVALAFVLGVSVAIGISALVAPAEAQAGAQDGLSAR